MLHIKALTSFGSCNFFEPFLWLYILNYTFFYIKLQQFNIPPQWRQSIECRKYNNKTILIYFTFISINTIMLRNLKPTLQLFNTRKSTKSYLSLNITSEPQDLFNWIQCSMLKKYISIKTLTPFPSNTLQLHWTINQSNLYNILYSTKTTIYTLSLSKIISEFQDPN